MAQIFGEGFDSHFPKEFMHKWKSKQSTVVHKTEITRTFWQRVKDVFVPPKPTELYLHLNFTQRGDWRTLEARVRVPVRPDNIIQEISCDTEMSIDGLVVVARFPEKERE